MKEKINKILVFIVLFLSFLIVFSSMWAVNTFGSVTVEEIVFTFMIPQDGMNISVIYSYILGTLLITVLAVLFFYYLLFKKNKKEIKVNFSVGNLNINKVIYPFNKFINNLLILIIFIGSLYYSFDKLDINEYIKYQFVSSSLIEDEYVDTKNVDINFEDKKRNLIYIYLESMESSYTSFSNGGIQENDLIDDLVKLSNEYISFSNTDKLGGAQSVPGTTWTSGAMVAHTSGLPLKLSIGDKTYSKYKTFLPGAWTLGDILNENGYNQMLMIGSDATFGGRDGYFTKHGNYQIFDVNTAIERKLMTEEDRVWWGFEDKKLFEYAKDEIIKLSRDDKPFNFTLLTVDTHFEDGYLSDECDIDLGNQYSSVISCASDMVYEFVKWIQMQEFYDNTTIVLVGDHLTMDVDFFSDDDSNYVRTIYNVFINSVVDTDNLNNRVFTTMDFFPTTLASMGVKVDGDRLGLGTNLFSDKKTIAEEYGIDVLRDELSKKSKFYDEEILYKK